MASQIYPSRPQDGVPAAKPDLRANLQSAKDEIEALQDGEAALIHGHAVADPATTGTADTTTFLRGDGAWAPETALGGAHTLTAADLGSLLTYGGTGDVWTVTGPGRSGEVAIENDGSGAITLSPSGVSIANGMTVIGAGKSASVQPFAGVKVLPEA